jgi:hypothetical protein
MAGLRFILRVLPLVFWPLPAIDFIGYSGWHYCGVALGVPFCINSFESGARLHHAASTSSAGARNALRGCVADEIVAGGLG